MKIFISYAHNDHTALVDALFDALLRAGHEPWKDDRYEGRSGIKPGGDFVNVIYDAIDESDFVIAFLTRRSVASQFCQEERQYAYNHKGTRFIQLRLDGVEIRLGNARSYIDMDAVEDSAGRINQTLFAQKLQALEAAFRDPLSLDTSFHAKFERYLMVRGAMQYEEFIAMPEHDDFVGREWLKEKCKRWAMDDSIPCRLFVLYGEAGTGKTAFVRHLAMDQELVRSVHVCIYDRPRTRSVTDTLKNLAYTLTLTNAAYREALKFKNFELLKDLDYDGLFEFLFVEPLKHETEKYLLIIDGLDELEENSGLTPLIKVLRQYARVINPNVSILVTSRPDESIVGKLRTVNAAASQRETLTRENSERDLSEFIRRNLTALGCHTDALQQRILTACDGNFEYLTLLFREAREEGLALTGDTRLPRGLNERYTQYLDRRMERHHLEEELTREQYTLLSVLSVAYEPLPLSLLADVAGYDEYDAGHALTQLGSLIRRTALPGGDRLIAFFSKGFRDYLLSGVQDNYRVNAALGTRAIARYVMQRCPTGAALLQHPYLDRHSLTHILLHMRKDREACTAYLDKLKAADRDGTIKRIAEAVCDGGQDAVEGYFAEDGGDDQGSVLSQLEAMRAIQSLSSIAMLSEAQGALDDAWTLQADILLMNPSPQALNEAGQLYQRAVRYSEDAYSKLKTYDTRRDLAIAYSRLGSLAEVRSASEDLTRAEEWFLKTLDLLELNFRENPCYESRHSLASAYNLLGGIAKARSTHEDLARAEEWLLKALALNEQNFRENPCYQSRRSLAVTYERLGDLAKARSTPEDLARAEEWFLKALALYEQSFRENPCYESRNSLASVYDYLGILAQARSTPEDLARAEEWFLKALVLLEQSFRENPCYESRRKLAVLYDRLGVLTKARSAPEDLARSEDWFLKGLALLAQNFRENPCYDSRRGLALIYNRLGDLTQARNTPEDLVRAEDWFLKGLALDEQNFRENPCYESRRSLAVTYDRLGDLAKAHSTPPDLARAEEWFLKGLALDEQSFRENPCYQSRRNLAITYGRLGDFAQARGTPEDLARAEEWFLKKLALDEQNFRENPCYESRNILASAYDYLGILAQARSTPEDLARAEEWFLKALVLLEQSFRENPCYESRRSLAVTYDRLGVLAHVGSIPGDLARAEEWFLKELALFEQNFRENPCYQSRRSLAITYLRLGVLAKTRSTPEDLARAEDWFLKELALVEQNFRENPCPQSRDDLQNTYAHLHLLSEAKSTPEGDKEADQWAAKYFALKQDTP